jgi:hypothetical protein
MSANPKPTSEELRFVYDLILKGNTDADILAEYGHLLEAGQLMFPSRVDKRFVWERRKELEAAKAVLEGHLKAVDPIVVKRKEEHFNHMAQILESIITEKTTIIEVVGSEYVMRGDNGKQINITKEQFPYSLRGMLQLAAKQFGDTDIYEYLLPHLQAELGEGKELNAFIADNPLKSYHILRLLADKRVFKGKCPMCAEW